MALPSWSLTFLRPSFAAGNRIGDLVAAHFSLRFCRPPRAKTPTLKGRPQCFKFHREQQRRGLAVVVSDLYDVNGPSSAARYLTSPKPPRYERTLSALRR